jgi:membrane protein DedA with SNARE-associated domain
MLIYGAIGGILAIVLAAVSLPLLPALGVRIDPNAAHPLMMGIPALMGAFVGAWCGRLINNRFKRQALTPDDDRRFSKTFVMALIVIALVITLMRFIGCTFLHGSLPMC